MIVLIDMDDVLADFDGEIYSRWKKLYPDKYVVPPEERKCFYLYDEMPPESKDLLRGINTTKGFIRNLPEIPGSIKAFNEIASLGHDIFICTAPLVRYENCVLEKYQWVEEHLGMQWTEKMILTRDKTLIQGDILIDDKPIINGIKEPCWEHIIFDKAYNSKILNQRRINWQNWKDILTDLL